VDQFIADIDTSPLYNAEGTIVTAVTCQDVRDSISGALYQPILNFPPLAEMIADALAGNLTSLVSNVIPGDIHDDCAAGNQIVSEEASYAIRCSDAADNQTEHDLAYYSDEIIKFKNQSATFGAKWTTIPFQCVGYRLRPKYQFRGPWVTPPAELDLKPGAPGAPLLFLASRIDPVTPFINANAMSTGTPVQQW
jgi:hypothetical protein